MTSGIYKLVFSNGASYIGKSVDIERRWKEHYDNMLSGKASKRMQSMFNKYGAPKGLVLLECNKDHIDLMETAHILKNGPELNSADTMKITEFEYSTLTSNVDLLKLSTSEHIELINKQNELIARQKENIRKFVDDEFDNSVEEELEDLQEKHAYIITELVECKKKLERERRSWWTKIFG